MEKKNKRTAETIVNASDLYNNLNKSKKRIRVTHVNDQVFNELCKSFYTSIMRQSQEPENLMLFYKLTHPYTNLFSETMLRLLLQRTFGYSSEWKYDNDRSLIYINAVRLKEQCGMILANAKEVFNVTKFDNYNTILDKITETQQSFELEREQALLNLKNKHYKELLLNFLKVATVEASSTYTKVRISGFTIYLSFCYYYSYISRGEMWNFINYERFMDHFDPIVKSEQFPYIKMVKHVVKEHYMYFRGFYIKLPKNFRYPEYIESLPREDKETNLLVTTAPTMQFF